MGDPDSYVLGKGVFQGESVTWMARWCLQEAHGVIICDNRALTFRNIAE
ncbi:MAG: hypothetical protein O2923_13020 [Verrucomicrobia bacterium]|nr:hypothetical protein [Verrucomicrobiota bacterium]MDA1088263.1 hypothetical protein [Verrucomicrobiota bacterium]